MSELRSYWEILAQKLEREPEKLAIARENIARWLAQDHSAPHRLRQWDALLAAAQDDSNAFQHVLKILRTPNCEEERLREFDVFPGILTREERRQARELCGYRH